VKTGGSKRALLPIILLAAALVFAYPPYARSETSSPQSPQSDEGVSAFIRRGTARLKEGRYEEAVEEFRTARRRDPGSSMAAYMLGLAYLKSQDYREASAHLKEAVTLRPRVREALVELADALYELNENDEALRYADIAEREGVEPARAKFLKGLIHLRLGNTGEAAKRLAEAKAADESLSQASTYHIAIAALREGRLTEARGLFEEAASIDPSSDIAEFTRQYVSAIERRERDARPLKLYAGLEYRYDDNVLLKPADAAAAGDITGEGDSLGVLTFRSEYDPRLRGPYGLGLRYSFYLDYHASLETHDVQSHTVSIAPSYALKRGQASLYMGYAYTLVENASYLHTTTLSPVYAFSVRDVHLLQASVKLQFKDYQKYTEGSDPDEDRDGVDYGAGVSYLYPIAGDAGFVNLRYELNREDTDGVNWGYLGNKLSAGALYPLSSLREGLKIASGIEMYFQNYIEEHTAFNEKRTDGTYTFYLMPVYTVMKDVDLRMNYVYMRGSSNIELYDYDKNIISAGVEARF
jgi:tetratricopeptide (TPR) repeat protein